eukprot:7940985-Alexandrium_andersonii.AAC.1
MSASLVGSEMCIRDRSSESRRGAACQREQLLVSAAGRFRSCSRLSDGPVSYTHLTLPTICSV